MVLVDLIGAAKDRFDSIGNELLGEGRDEPWVLAVLLGATSLVLLTLAVKSSGLGIVLGTIVIVRVLITPFV